MPDEMVQQMIVRAVQQTFDVWAREHPSLSTVIDRITLTERAATSIRQSDEFRQAVSAYHAGRNELDLLNRLLDLAGPVVAALLTM